jgi:hypothetical protein
LTAAIHRERGIVLSKRFIVRALLALVAALVLAIVAAPYFSAERFRSRVEAGLERAMQRDVRIGEVRFSLWPGPGFTIRDVVIADHPDISAEPFAYVNETRVGLGISSLWRGELAFSSITLTQPSVNIAQGPTGTWNYEQILRSGVGAGTRSEGSLPEIVVREGRINFRSGLRKSIYYFRSADLRLTEEGQGTGAWLLEFRAEPARTDSYAPRFGTLRGRGRWRASAGRNGELDMDVEIERSPVAEIASLFRASRVGLSGFLAARAHLSGPAEALALRGTLELSERGDWGLFTLPGQTAAVPMEGTLNLPLRRLRLAASPAFDGAAIASPAPVADAGAGTAPPGAPALSEADPIASFAATLDVNPEFANGQWVAQVNFTSMPVERVMSLLQYLDDSLPHYPQLEGTLDGEVSYRSIEGLRGVVSGRRMRWRPEAAGAFTLRTMQVKLEGNTVEGGGFLDLAAVDPQDSPVVSRESPVVSRQSPTAPNEAAAPLPDAEASAAADLPRIGFTLDRQSGKIVAELQGTRLAGEHFDALRQLAPVIDGRPALLAGGRWQASGNAVWQRTSFRGPGEWNGQLLVRGLAVPVDGLASPVVFRSAPLQLRGAGWRITGASAEVAGIAAKADVAVDAPLPGSPSLVYRPTTLNLTLDELDLRKLDAAVRFAAAEDRGFLSRTFSLRGPGRPLWLRNRSLAAKVYIRKVLIEDSKYYDARGDLFWDGVALEARNISVQSRFGPIQAALRANLAAETPRWSWSLLGRNLPWRGGELDLASEWNAEGAIESLPETARGNSEITWRRSAGVDSDVASSVRVSLRWNPGAREPQICPQCVEFRSGSEVGVGGCEASNGTTLRCPLEDPRTGEKHEINLPISLFGLGAN